VDDLNGSDRVLVDRGLAAAATATVTATNFGLDLHVGTPSALDGVRVRRQTAAATATVTATNFALDLHRVSPCVK